MATLRQLCHARLDGDRRRALVDLPCKEVAGRNAAERQHSAAPDGDARPDDRARCEPDLVLNNDRLGHKIEAASAPVMTSRAEISTLRQTAMIADADFGKVVEPDMFADPAMIADFQPPRKLHHDAGLDRDVAADARAEQPK